MSDSKPTIIITPGAWHVPQPYTKLINALGDKGFTAIAVSLPTGTTSPPLPGWEKDAEAARTAILKEFDNGHDIIALAHSFGGVAMGEAVRGLGKEQRRKIGHNTGVRRLIYMCAMAIPEGQTHVAQISPVGAEEERIAKERDELAAKYGPPPMTEDGAILLNKEAMRDIFYNRCSKKDIDQAVSLLGSFTPGPLTVPTTYSAFAEIPSTYIVCENDRALPVQVQERMIPQVKGVFTVERCQEGHSPFLSNPGLDTTILDSRLAKIYNTIITGSASRFADFECNLYATVSRYRLDDADSEGSIGQLLPSSESSSGLIEYARSSERGKAPQSYTPPLDNAGHHMTALGIVRFLDHFSGLYGNHLSASASRQSNETLKAVLRVFSMQWLSTSQNPSPDALMDAYTDAWFQARSLLQSTQSHYIRSFRLIYALILFHGLSIPTKARQAVPEHESLATGLETLLYLQRLVRKHCDTLGQSSMYKSIFEASLSVIAWAGYIRDIGAALTADHRCMLPCPDLRTNKLETSMPGDTMVQLVRHIDEPVLESPVLTTSSPDLDGCVPTICRGAVAHAFVVWRDIIIVKELLSSRTPTTQTLSAAVFAAATGVGRFNDTFNTFIRHCTDFLNRLSIRSKISFISIILPWNLGILILSETLKPIMADTSLIPITPELSSQLHTYRRKAVSTITQIATKILSQRSEETKNFNAENGLVPDVPILAFHVTVGLTVMTFGKAIEATIDMQASMSSGNNAEERNTGDLQLGQDDSWKKDVGTLMEALSLLDTIVGGKEVTRCVFDGLLRRHADVLCDCWSGGLDDF
ncbi:Alpha/beta hydrolase family-domain-containing protein [Aspergillus oleicola]